MYGGGIAIGRLLLSAYPQMLACSREHLPLDGGIEQRSLIVSFDVNGYGGLLLN